VEPLSLLDVVLLDDDDDGRFRLKPTVVPPPYIDGRGVDDRKKIWKNDGRELEGVNHQVIISRGGLHFR